MKSKLQFDVLVVGSINSDFMVRTQVLPAPGETQEGSRLLVSHGGKGANQAVACARLGSRVALLAKVGNDERGESSVPHLKAQGVDTRFILREDSAPTGAALIVVDAKGEKQIVTAPGANHRLTIRDVRRALKQIDHVSVLLMQFEVPGPVVAAAARLGRARRALVILDPAPPIKLRDKNFLKSVDLIRPNASEAEALTGISVRDAESARQAAQRLIRWGAGAVVVSAGDDGCLLRWAGGERFYRNVRVKVLDTTGAGDAFVAAMAVALAEGDSLPDAAHQANVAAALATTKAGAQAGLPSRQQLTRALRRF